MQQINASQHKQSSNKAAGSNIFIFKCKKYIAF